jgi:hypothetical protein
MCAPWANTFVNFGFYIFPTLLALTFASFLLEKPIRIKIQSSLANPVRV